VQDNNEKNKLRDFRERFEEERKGIQVGNISQEILGTFPKEKNYFVSVEIYCYVGGRTVRICIVHTTEKWACFLRQGRHKNQCSLRIFVVEVKLYITCRTTSNWHDFQGVVFLGGS
jgi:hypothetical protein